MSTLAANQWFIPYDQLDSDQRRLVNGDIFSNGSSVGWILGPAGSGKTIVLANALAKAKQEGKSVAFISYTYALLNLASQGLEAGIPRYTYHKAGNARGCDLVVVDEVQDVPPAVLQRLINANTKIIFAGDETQRIYGDGATKAELIGLTANNKHKLTRAYRLTPQVHAAASALYPAALEGVSPSGKTKVDIELYSTQDAAKGDQVCYKIATAEAQKARTAAILLPTKDRIVDFANWALMESGRAHWDVVQNGYGKPDFAALNAHLEGNNVPLQIVQNNYGDLGDAFRKNHVVLQTYHSAKGLDYGCVCLPNVAVEEATGDEFQKALFFVAITRASKALIITHRATRTPTFVRQIMPFCTPMDAGRALATAASFDDDDF